MIFELTVLGNGSAIPSFGRHHSSQVLNFHDRLFLIDCGEGTQYQIQQYHIKHSRIQHIYISHLHGDHFYGLPGFLNSMHLLGREKSLHLFGPKGLQDILDVMHQYSKRELGYPLEFHTLEDMPKVLWEDEELIVEQFEMLHKIPCYGFLFREKKQIRNIDKSKIKAYNIPIESMKDLQHGADLTLEDGTIVPNKEVTLDPPTPRSYAYCPDTAFHKPLIEKVNQVSLLYHEATFSKDMNDIAVSRYHSTTEQAATIAKEAEVKELLIGHFSGKYEQLEPLLEEAQDIFPNTQLALEGNTYPVG